ncbi:MAG: hypothetical protein ACK506_12510 [Pirellula sp.]
MNDPYYLIRAKCGRDRRLWGGRRYEMHGQAGVAASQSTSDFWWEITDFMIVTYS